MSFLSTCSGRPAAGDEYFFDDIVLEAVAPASTMPGKEAIAEKLDNSASQSDVPLQFQLNQNFPNPFNPSTTIRYALSKPSHVTVAVYDMLGRQMATLVNGLEPSGYKAAVFSAVSLSSGMYLYRLEARPVDGSEPFVSVGRMLFLK